MKKEWLVKTLAMAIVVLFISVSFQPIIAKDTILPISTVTQNKYNNIEQISISFSQPILKNEEQYITVKINEANSYLMKQGKPMLPALTQKFYFPFGTKIKNVSIKLYSIFTQKIAKDLMPTPQIFTVGEKINTNSVPIDYETELYPSTWFQYDDGCGIVDGKLSSIVDISIYPVKYYPAEKMLEYTNGTSVIIEFEPSTRQAQLNDEYSLVVIGPSDFSSQIAPLITHKINKGVTAKFVSLTEVYGGTYFPATGRDDQEKIKYFIKNAIENWGTIYVLLLGGDSDFPTRTTHVYIESEAPNPERFTSDLYYADIYNATGGFCSWDSNNNDLFAEYNWYGQTDQVDLHPDVYIARLACTSNTQVTTCVNKIIGYETTPGYQQSWFPNLVLVGGDTSLDSNGVNEGEYANSNVEELMNSFIPNELWVSNRKLTSLKPTGVSNIKDAIDAGCGFVDFSGHADTDDWATHPHLSLETWVPTPTPPGGFSVTDIKTLSNGEKLPIVTVEACWTSKFATDANCFSWAFISNANGGAIGSFGATGLGYCYTGSSVTQHLIGKIGLDTYKAYKLDKATTFGEMYADAIDNYIHAGMDKEDYKTVEEWQPFGDPSLVIAEESQPPAKPSTPSGPTDGKIGVEYTYTTMTTDPESDEIYYLFDWGDGTNSGWVGSLNNDTTASAKKIWSARAAYKIRVVAKDIHGQLSVVSDPLSVTIPRTRASHSSLFLRFLERFPLLERLLFLLK